MSTWSHLANAKHIDRIIAHVEANYETWDVAVRAAGYAQTQAARDAVRQAVYDVAWQTAAARDAALDAAWSVARDAAYDVAWVAVRDAVRDAAYEAAIEAARGAILALVAWDYAGDLMDSPAEQVKVLALLGDQTALLMYPAIAVMETTQELA